MYLIIRSAIAAGGYKLADMQHKIKRLYVMGNLEEGQMNELLTLASGGASAGAERPETLQMLKNLSDRLDALAEEVAALKGAAEEEDAAEESGSVYPVWEPWDGICDKYQPGTIVTHKGVIWISAYPGQNVWEPGTVDERFWAAYTPGEDV